jgi:hypothetical protein
MKYKYWFRLVVMSCLWLFFTTMIYGFIGIVLFIGDEQEIVTLQKFVMGELNTNFILVMSLGSLLGISIITTFLLSLSKDSDKLDELDKAIVDYHESKRRLDRKIREL